MILSDFYSILKLNQNIQQHLHNPISYNIVNGQSCIPLANCSTYTQAGCVIDVNLKPSCQRKSACKWTPADGTKSSSCSVHSCDSAAKGSNKCVSVPNFDATSYIICIVQGSKCVQGDPSTLTKENCYKMSQYTYTWNSNTEKCQSCVIKNTTQNNNTLNNTNNQTESQTNQSAIIRLIVVMVLLMLII